jgi:ADP-ribose pyrophosphatase
MAQNPKFEREIVSGSLVHIRKIAIDYITLPNGRRGRWESIYHDSEAGKTNVLVVGFTPEGKILLVEMYRTPVGQRIIELPGGTPSRFETFPGAAMRELREETGRSVIGRFQELTIGFCYPYQTNAVYRIYLARDCLKTQEPRPDEFEKFMGLRVLEKKPGEIFQEMSQDASRYDPLVSVALAALIGKGIIDLKNI